jgi:hypothetical protein
LECSEKGISDGNKPYFLLLTYMDKQHCIML